MGMGDSEADYGQRWKILNIKGDHEMTLKKFIKENRQELDACIKRACPNCDRFNDEERRLWILNDEGLYLWARGEGVRI